jgi:hypothetical protein
MFLERSSDPRKVELERLGSIPDDVIDGDPLDPKVIDRVFDHIHRYIEIVYSDAKDNPRVSMETFDYTGGWVLQIS